MEGCLLCLEINEEFVSCIKVGSSQWEKLDVEELIEKHFWPLETLQSYLWICSSCWQELYEFHKFYKRIEEAHANFGRLMKTKDDCQPLQHKHNLLNRAGYNTSLHNDNELHCFMESEIFIDQPLQESLVVIEEQELNIKEEPQEELDTDDMILNHRSMRRSYGHFKSKDPLKNPKENKLLKITKSKNSIPSTETILNGLASDQILIEQDPYLLNINIEPKLTLSCANNDDFDTDSSYEPNRDNMENKSAILSYYKHCTHRKETDKFIAENFKGMFCNRCLLPMDNFRDLHKHFAEEHKQKGYVICCKRKFYIRSLLVDHLHCHLNPDYFKCNQCDKVMCDRVHLKRHIKHMHGEGDKFVCNVCGKSFSVARYLKRHKLTHLSQEEKIFPCTECGKSYGSATKLKCHINAVHTKKFYKICFICGKSISSNSEFKIHMDKHEGKPAPLLNCDVCGLRLKSAGGLKHHKDAQHPEGGKKDHSCPICPKVSPTLRALKQHITTVADGHLNLA